MMSSAGDAPGGGERGGERGGAARGVNRSSVIYHLGRVLRRRGALADEAALYGRAVRDGAWQRADQG